jgi:hypothetical protein
MRRTSGFLSCRICRDARLAGEDTFFANILGRQLGTSPRRKVAPYLAPISFVRGRSSLSGADRESSSWPLTYQDELKRTAVDEGSPFAKVGVAGSNPVVHSNKKRRSDGVLGRVAYLRKPGDLLAPE